MVQVIAAIQKSVVDAKKSLTSVPLTKSASIPHATEAHFGAAKVCGAMGVLKEGRGPFFWGGLGYFQVALLVFLQHLRGPNLSLFCP